MGRENVSDIRRALMGGPPPGVAVVSTAPRDRFGNPIRTNDHVIYDPELPMVFKVTGTKAVLDPRMPQGLVEVELTCSAKLILPGNQPNGRFLCLGQQGPQGAPPETPQEQAPDGAETVDTAPPTTDTPLIVP